MGFFDPITKVAKQVVHHGAEVGKGFVEGAVDTGKGLVQVATHPKETLEGLGHAVLHPVDTFERSKLALSEAFHENPSQFFGRGLFEVLTLAGPAALTKIAKAEKLAEVGNVGSKLSKTTRLTEEGANIGKTGKAANLAGKAEEAAHEVVDVGRMLRLKQGVTIGERQLQKKFKHAGDFGIEGSYSPANAGKLEQAIQNHVQSSRTKVFEGTYRGDPVLHFLNPQTALDVITSRTGEFVSGWKLSPEQLNHVLSTGKLGGG